MLSIIVKSIVSSPLIIVPIVLSFDLYKLVVIIVLKLLKNLYIFFNFLLVFVSYNLNVLNFLLSKILISFKYFTYESYFVSSLLLLYIFIMLIDIFQKYIFLNFYNNQKIVYL